MVAKNPAQRRRLAENVAAELNRELVKVDLRQLVSKYIGETEKNLRKLFESAESRGAILFLEEGDALFGKRTNVKDAHDRYATQDVNYLLERIERSRSVIVLATATAKSIDPAFLRRLRFAIKLTGPTRRPSPKATTASKPPRRRVTS